MTAFHIYYGISAGEVVVGDKEGLVQVTAGVVPDVKDKVAHALFLEFKGGLVAFFVGGAGEFPEAEVPHGIGEHECGIHAVHGDFPTGYFKGYDFFLPLDGNGNLCSGGTLYSAHHAVLGELHAGNHLVVHFKQAVSYHEANFLRGAAGDNLQNYRSIIGDVELYADSVKVPGKFLFRCVTLHWRHVHGMGVQTGKGGGNRGISYGSAGKGVHVIAFNHLQDGVEFLPVTVLCRNHVLGLTVTHHRKSNEGAENDAHHYLKNLNCLFTHCLSAQQGYRPV